MGSHWRSRSSILLAQASSPHSTGDRGALSCWLKCLYCTQLEIEELYPAASNVLTALNWRSRRSILLAQASMDCTQLEIEELYPAGSNVLTALDWLAQACAAFMAPACRGRGGVASQLVCAGPRAMDSNWRLQSSILLAQASSPHSTGDCGALSCWLQRRDCTQLEIEELYPAGSNALRRSILLAQASSPHSTGDRGALSCWLKRLDCIPLAGPSLRSIYGSSVQR